MLSKVGFHMYQLAFSWVPILFLKGYGWNVFDNNVSDQLLTGPTIWKPRYLFRSFEYTHLWMANKNRLGKILKIKSCYNHFWTVVSDFWENFGKIWNRKSFIKHLKIGPHDPTFGQNLGFICIYLHANSGWNPTYFDIVRTIFSILIIWVRQLFFETTVQKSS